MAKAKKTLRAKMEEHNRLKRRWIIIAGVSVAVVVAFVVVLQVLVTTEAVDASSMGLNMAQFVVTMLGATMIGISVNGFYRENARLNELEKKAKSKSA